MNSHNELFRLEADSHPAPDSELEKSERIIKETSINNQEGLNITAYEKYIPCMFSKNGSILSEAYTVEGFKNITKDLTIDAQREKGTDSDYSVTFIDTDLGYDFQALSGKGMFSAKKQIEPFIKFIDRETSGKWYASCDDKRRMSVYRRWLPESKIRYE